MNEYLFGIGPSATPRSAKAINESVRQIEQGHAGAYRMDHDFWDFCHDLGQLVLRLSMLAGGVDGEFDDE